MSYEISSTYISERYRQHLAAGMSHMQACSRIHPPPSASVMFRRSFELVKKCLVKNKHLAQSWSEPHEGFTIVWPDIKEASRHDSIVIPPNRIETKQKAKAGRHQLLLPTAKSTKTPTPEQWQAHKGVIVNDSLGVLKMLSIPLCAYGIYRAFSEGVISAGLGYMAVWPLLQGFIPKKEKHQ
jgi:hypothetical protein